MCHSPHDPVTLQCISAGSEDSAFFDYARRLTRDNMQADYRRHGLAWDDAHFARDWRETQNYLIRTGDSRLGVLRLCLEPPACYLRDLQIVPCRQRQGLGRWCLQRVTALALANGCRHLRLRAFHDSAAVRLYQRHGFHLVGREGALVRMEVVLAEPLATT